ncbi:MAG: tetratricopeptide repeat protein [Gammaproteobacteria bacterium]|nr:tetratricopeptide repeat protein [Gammaproteobacteria bacterium]
MYYDAFGEGHNAFTLEVARVIYNRYQKTDDLALLVQSLLSLDKTKEAIVLLRPYKGGRSHLSFLYEKVLMQAWVATSSSAYENEVASIWIKRLASTDMPRKERRRLAFQLLNLGRKAEALGQFELLAQSETSSGDNVKQLLYIWGPLPGETALDWLEHRAQSASAGDLAGWWQHLAQAGGEDRIVKMATHRREALRPRAESIAIESFISTGNKTRLEAYLREQIGRNSHEVRLVSLAQYAQNEGLAGLATSAWTKIIQKYPSNTKANYALGMSSFSKGDLVGAEQHLARYVSDVSSDWEGTYYLAEALLANGKKREAQKFFKISLQQLRKTGSMRKRIRMTMGLIYYRLNRSKEAMGEFDSLIKQYPNDTYLRATYSTLLIEHGKLKKAGLLLGSLSDHLKYYGGGVS